MAGASAASIPSSVLAGEGDRLLEEKLSFRLAMATRAERAKFEQLQQDTGCCNVIDKQEMSTASAINLQMDRGKDKPSFESRNRNPLLLPPPPTAHHRHHHPPFFPAAEAWRSLHRQALLPPPPPMLATSMSHHQQPFRKRELCSSWLPAAGDEALTSPMRIKEHQAGGRDCELRFLPRPPVPTMTLTATSGITTTVASDSAATTTMASCYSRSSPSTPLQRHPQPPYVVGQGNKRYRECMDYAHLGCRHFVPCNDGDTDPRLQMQSPPKQATLLSGSNCRDGSAVSIKLELDRSFLGRSAFVHQQQQQYPQAQQEMRCSRRSRSSKVDELQNSASDRERQLATEVKLEPAVALPPPLCSSEATTTTMAESAESVVNVRNGLAAPAGDDGHGREGEERREEETAVKDRQESKEQKQVDSEESEDDGDVPIALDLLAQAAIQVASEMGDQAHSPPGSSSSKKRVARFVHGEIPFEQKRVRRSARPSAKLVAAFASDSGVGSRLPQRQATRKRCEDFEYALVAKKTRVAKEEKNPKACSSPRSAPKKKKAPAKKTIVSSNRKQAKKSVPPLDVVPAKTVIGSMEANHVEVEDDDLEEEEDELGRRSKWSSTPKKKNLEALGKASAVVPVYDDWDHGEKQEQDEDEDVRRKVDSSEFVRKQSQRGKVKQQLQQLQQQKQQKQEDEAAAAAKQGAVVRSTRGRNQVLPVRFQGSIIGTWKKGIRKKPNW